MEKLRHIHHAAELCVIGGGLGGMLTALAAARHGVKVVLMHDRPVLGGNASSEIRMHVCGAGTRVRNLQETGIIEEIMLENMHRNPTRNYTLWDSILYEKIRFEPNIDLLLNCACCDLTMEGERIAGVKGFQLTTYTWHTVAAPLFVDCSGDSILAPLSGAEYRVGREARSEYGEEFGLEQADGKTMGMSLMIHCRQTDHPCAFVPPKWAYTFKTDDDMRNKPHRCLTDLNTNFYWIELGGEMDSIHDTEAIRDELLKIAFGVWDHMKNQGDHDADNWELEWIGFLPGKRESRRYVGDYTLTQQDVEGAAAFDDEVAYGGWQIDNHLPGGFFMDGLAGNHLQKRRLTEPYGIPLRCMYSVNVPNLMFAGRNISASHIAFSTTRVMSTVAVIGQAVGSAAAIALRHGLTPREVARDKIREVQAMLMEDDCFLPHFRREPSALSRSAALSCDYGSCDVLQNGLDRKIWGRDNGYWGRINQAVTYTFAEKTRVRGFRLVLDSDLDREYIDGNPDLLTISMVACRKLAYDNTSFGFPRCMVRHFRIEALAEDGRWVAVYECDDNYQRLVRHALDVETTAIRYVPLATYATDMVTETYGSGQAHVFAFDVYDEEMEHA
ncbi:FAD-dependent oxidoreductase [Eubacteriales bacterium OttesenSCG-928-A19]|nr:FAD-dependent oxidoreductase [Eubacteriales bacterium OttesenSCG-928-A19]